jgi:hypothetical protein
MHKERGAQKWQRQNVEVLCGKLLQELEAHAQFVSQHGSNCFTLKQKVMGNKLQYVKGAIQHLLKESITP